MIRSVSRYSTLLVLLVCSQLSPLKSQIAPASQLSTLNSQLFLYDGDHLAVPDDQLLASTVFLGVGPSRFPGFPDIVQSGGEAQVHDLLIGCGTEGHGEYYLQDGLLTSHSLRLGPAGRCSGVFVQSGGTNLADSLTMSEGPSEGDMLPDHYSESIYALTSGLLQTTESTIGAGRNASFRQSGGLHSSTVIYLCGDTVTAHYGLSAGLISTRDFYMKTASFDHYAGTNQVAGDLYVGTNATDSACYELVDGALYTGSTHVLSRSLGDPPFNHSGGLHFVSNTLHVGSTYRHSAGELNVNILRLSGTLQDQGGQTSIRSLQLDNGIFFPSTGSTDLGTVQLLNNGAIRFPDSTSCALYFADSAELTWNENATLTLERWQGSVNGAGAHTITFGNNASALSSQQLARILFSDPLGFPPGLYPARILPTGELVPDSAPRLVSNNVNSQLSIKWTGPWTLQSATNPNGPYADVSNPTNPYTPTGRNPRSLFFRLRK